MRHRPQGDEGATTIRQCLRRQRGVGEAVAGSVTAAARDSGGEDVLVGLGHGEEVRHASRLGGEECKEDQLQGSEGTSGAELRGGAGFGGAV